jgi:hypothetical protein
VTTNDNPSGPAGIAAEASDALSQLVDGRQSDTALAIARGARRCLLAHGLATITEFTLASGRRADLAALSDNGEIWIVEIKSSLADFRADQKWAEYRDFCDRLFFAVANDFPVDVLPVDCGLILADRYGAEIVRPAPEHKLAPARRKAVVHRFARVAALRLHGLADPEIGLEE